MIKHRRPCTQSLIQKGRRLKLPTDIMLKLFDSCVAPILLYGCEVWGYENTDIIEKVHTKFCKFIFGVSKFSHNMPIYGELGRYPLSITIKFIRQAGLNVLIQFFKIMA